MAFAASTLAACEGLPPSPVPRTLGWTTVLDNPPYMNEPNLGILRYWFNYTHSPDIVTTVAGSDVETVQTGPDPDPGLLSAASVTTAMPDNVIMARAAWFSGGYSCAAGILLTGGMAVFTVFNPPAGLGATIVTWGSVAGGGALTLDTCWDLFNGEVAADASSRWLLSCRNAYLTGNDWNMLDPGWVPSNVVKWQECVVFGWAAIRAAQLGLPVDDNGIAYPSNFHCTPELIPRCWWD